MGHRNQSVKTAYDFFDFYCLI